MTKAIALINCHEEISQLVVD